MALPFVRRLVTGALIQLGIASGCGAEADRDEAAVSEPSGAPSTEWQGMAGNGDGFLVWESNRTGSWRIWTRRLDGSGLRQLSPDEPGHDHMAAHISPDGTRVVYLSYPKPWNSYRRVPKNVDVELRLLNLVDGTSRVLATDADSYGESRSAVWVDGHRLVYVGRDGSTRELELSTGESRTLATSSESTNHFLVNATHTHGTNNNPTFSIFDVCDINITIV